MHGELEVAQNGENGPVDEHRTARSLETGWYSFVSLSRLLLRETILTPFEAASDLQSAVLGTGIRQGLPPHVRR